MQSPEDAAIAGLLWSKAILLRCQLGQHDLLPAKIGSWLFTTSTWPCLPAGGSPLEAAANSVA